MDDQKQIQIKKPSPLGQLLQQNPTVSESEQKDLNKPLTDPTGVSAEDQAFLQDVIAKIDGGKINLYHPGSLINTAVYDALSEEQRGKVDMNAMTLLSNVRNIKDLYSQGMADTYQIQNLVNSCRLMKERVEHDCGDCYII